MKSILLILTCLLINFIHAEPVIIPVQPSPMIIQSVELSGNKTYMTLDNGTQWRYSDQDLFVPSGWRLNDRIQIVYSYFYGYHIENISCQGCVPVKLVNHESTDIIATQIETISKNENSTYTITLLDQTRWYVGSWSGSWMEDWQVGDRVIVTPHKFMLGNANYLIMNLDREVLSEFPANVRAELLFPLEQPIYPEDPNKRQGRSWPLFVTSVTTDNEAIQLELNNKAVYQIFPTNDKQKDWKIDDKITLEPFDDYFEIKNQRTKVTIETTLLNKDDPNLKTFTVVDKHCKGKKIELDDGSIWYLESGKNRCQVGDRIIISEMSLMSLNTETHYLINLDRLNKYSKEPCYYSATLVR